jgi:hypothetical protein
VDEIFLQVQALKHAFKEKDRHTPLDEPSTSRTCNTDDEWEEVSENDQICGNADTLVATMTLLMMEGML